VRLVVLQNLAEVSYKQGEWAQAVRHCEASLAVAAEIEDEVQAIRTQKIYALALHASAERARAWQSLRQAVAVGYTAEALPALMDVLTGVGALLLAEGETAVAIDLLQFICAHPATEQQYVQEAKGLLAGVNAAVADSDLGVEERPLAEIIDMVLTKISHFVTPRTFR